jgi:hypothetical protein
MAPTLRSNSSTRLQAKSSQMSTRITRQRTEINQANLQPTEVDIIDDVVLPSIPSHPQCPARAFSGIVLPDTLTQLITGLDKHDLAVLRKKQQWLCEFEVTHTTSSKRNGYDNSH